MPVCFLIRETKKGYGFGWVEHWEKLEEVGREAIIRIDCMKKNLISIKI